MFHDVIELVKSYGPSMAGWVLLFVFVAMVAGKGGKIALNNVKTLLDEGEKLRGRMKVSLDECEQQILRRDRRIRVFEQESERLHESLRSMKREIIELETTVHRLHAELEEARSMRRKGDLPHDKP